MEKPASNPARFGRYKYVILIPIIVIVVYCIYCCFLFTPSQTTFIILRHAEKNGNGPTDPLSDKGFQRADSLAYMLQDVEIDGIYATEFLRTQQTVTPVATAKGLTIVQYPVATDPATIDTFISQLFSDHKGKTVVVVGHSNTVHLLVNNILGNNQLTTINSNAFDHFFLVNSLHQGNGKLIPLKYSFHTP